MNKLLFARNKERLLKDEKSHVLTYMKTSCRIFFVTLLLMLWSFSFSYAQQNLPAAQRVEKEGVVISLSVKGLTDKGTLADKLSEGDQAVVTFNLVDAKTNRPVMGLRPKAWMSLSKSGSALGEKECKDRIQTFMSGSLGNRPDIDLNSYVLLTLNHDKTVSVLSPQTGLGTGRLESLILLPGAGGDWILSQNKEFLYITLPEQSSVAIINTSTRKIETVIPLGIPGKPVSILSQPDERYIWIGFDKSPSLAVIDRTTNKVTGIISVGAGNHQMAFAPDSQKVFVTNSDTDTISVIDTKKLSKIGDISVGKSPNSIAYGSASRLIYAIANDGKTVAVIDPTKQQVIVSIITKPGAGLLRFTPDGKFGFLLNPLDDTVSILDASTNKIINAAKVVKAPDQVTFTPGYAYIRGAGSERISLISLSGISKGEIKVLEVPAGVLAPSAPQESIGVGNMIAATPESNSVMIANAADQTIYYYVEGMMAPMGTISNYKRRPHALLILDQSLSETSPGTYSTRIKLSKAGRFDVPFLIDKPQITNCFQIEVGENSTSTVKPASQITMEALFKDKQFKSKEAVSLRFKITDTATKQPITGLTDLQVLVFQPPGIWQERQFAKEVAPGIYEINQAFPQDGVYNVMIRIASRHITFRDLPFVALKVGNM